MERWSSGRAVSVAIAGVIFAGCSLMPLGYMLAIPVSSGAAPLDMWHLDARQQGLLWNTTLFGAGTALLATLAGAPLGLALARVPLRGKAALRVALGTPLLLPPYVVALAWIYLAGRQSPLAFLARFDAFAAWTHSLPGAIVVMSLVLYPLSMLATEAALRRIDGRLEEAARLVAPRGRVLARITLPLAAPAVGAAALVIFVLAVSEFGVPGLLRVRVYTTEVFTAFAALYDSGRAMALAVPLLAMCLIVAAAAVAAVGDRLVVTRRGTGTPSPPWDGWQRPAQMATIAVLALALGIPLTTLVTEAGSVRSMLAAIEGAGPAILNSLMLSTVGATAVVGVALWLGYGRARASGRTGQAADVLFVLAFAVPGTIVGVGLIGLWNRPGPAGALYGTDAMFVLGYLARFIPVAALILAAATRSVPESHEEAAAVGGAGWLPTFGRIVFPQLRPGLLAAWVIAFILSFGELGASILVAPPGEATLPIRIYTLIANAPPSDVAALALLQTAVILTAVGVLAAVVSWRSPGTRG